MGYSQQKYFKVNGSLCFAKNIGRNVISKYGQNLLDQKKISAMDAITIASKTANQKIAEATPDFIGNEIVSKLTIKPKSLEKSVRSTGAKDCE